MPIYDRPLTLVPGLDAALRLVEQEVRPSDVEHVVVFRQDGTEINRAEGSRDNVEMPGPPEQLAGAVVVHNHSGGGGLSPKDVFRAAEFDLFELRAVPNNETAVYRLQCPAGGWPDLGTLEAFTSVWNSIDEAVYAALGDNPAAEDQATYWTLRAHWIAEQLAARFGLRYTREQR